MLAQAVLRESARTAPFLLSLLLLSSARLHLLSQENAANGAQPSLQPGIARAEW